MEAMAAQVTAPAATSCRRHPYRIVLMGAFNQKYDAFERMVAAKEIFNISSQEHINMLSVRLRDHGSPEPAAR